MTKDYWENRKLIKFSVYTAGGMNGGFHRVTVSAPANASGADLTLMEDENEVTSSAPANASAALVVSDSNRCENGGEDDSYGMNVAVLVCSDCAHHGQEPVTKEYTVDLKVLDEIKAVFLEEGMYKWNDKKFSSRFVADKASTTYSFEFAGDDVGDAAISDVSGAANDAAGDTVSFSSQIYPQEYKEKLRKINKIIEACCSPEDI